VVNVNVSLVTMETNAKMNVRCPFLVRIVRKCVNVPTEIVTTPRESVQCVLQVIRDQIVTRSVHRERGG